LAGVAGCWPASLAAGPSGCWHADVLLAGFAGCWRFALLARRRAAGPAGC